MPPTRLAERKGVGVKGWVKYGLVALVAFVAGVGVGAGGASSSSTEQAAGGSAIVPAGETTTTLPPVTTEPSPTQEPVLKGTWRVTSCDLLLFTQGNSSTLVGAVEVNNTGTVDSKVTVSLKWDALPGPLFDGGTKSVTLHPGQSREIRFTRKGLGLTDVDRVQASPGYKKGGDKLCIVKAHETQA